MPNCRQIFLMKGEPLRDTTEKQFEFVHKSWNPLRTPCTDCLLLRTVQESFLGHSFPLALKKEWCLISSRLNTSLVSKYQVQNLCPMQCRGSWIIFRSGKRNEAKAATSKACLNSVTYLGERMTAYLVKSFVLENTFSCPPAKI